MVGNFHRKTMVEQIFVFIINFPSLGFINCNMLQIKNLLTKLSRLEAILTLFRLPKQICIYSNLKIRIKKRGLTFY